MLSREQLDRIHVAFDDDRLVANAGLLLPVTLAHHLGLGELVDNHVDLGDAPGRANAGDKMLTLAATASTPPMCCGLAVPIVCWVAWSRRHPPWGPSLYLGGAGTRQTVPS